MHTLPLNNSSELVLVDSEDFTEQGQYKWRLLPNGYVCRTVNSTAVYIHRRIMNLGLDDRKKYVDHINKNKLDNRKENLRVVTPSENNQSKAQNKGTSKYKGVYWCKPRGLWVAEIKNERKLKYLGGFTTEEEAALAYNKKAMELFKYPLLNII